MAACIVGGRFASFFFFFPVWFSAYGFYGFSAVSDRFLFTGRVHLYEWG